MGEKRKDTPPRCRSLSPLPLSLTLPRCRPRCPRWRHGGEPISSRQGAVVFPANEHLEILATVAHGEGNAQGAINTLNLRLSSGVGRRGCRAAACPKARPAATIKHNPTHRVRPWLCTILRFWAPAMSGIRCTIACVSVSRRLGTPLWPSSERLFVRTLRS